MNNKLLLSYWSHEERLLRWILAFILIIFLASLVSSFSIPEMSSACVSLNLSGVDCSNFWGNYSLNQTVVVQNTTFVYLNQTVYVQNVSYLNQTVYIQNNSCDLNLSIPYQRLLVDYDKCTYNSSSKFDTSSFYSKQEVDERLVSIKSSFNQSQNNSSKNNNYLFIGILLFCVIAGFFYYKNRISLPKPSSDYPSIGYPSHEHKSSQTDVSKTS